MKNIAINDLSEMVDGSDAANVVGGIKMKPVYVTSFQTGGASSGMATGKRQHKPISITKEVDK